MTQGLIALLSGAIDYAGLFPPAGLRLAEAIANYARYRREPEAWMLGRFVIPAARLAELDAHADHFAEGEPLAFSVLGSGGKTRYDVPNGLAADLKSVAAFRERHGERVVVDAYEVRFPSDAIGPDPRNPQLPPMLSYLWRMIDAEGPPALSSYYEIPAAEGWRAVTAGVAEAVAADNALGPTRAARRWRPAGVKLRCGGLEPAAFPAAEKVAFTLAACRRAGVTLKFTAGLHHPLRRFDQGLGCRVHGFVNVFVAGALGYARGLGEDRLREVLEEEDPGAFHFDDSGLRWGGLHVSTAEILLARSGAMASFGSCSFDEPRDDLKALGWL